MMMMMIVQDSLVVATIVSALLLPGEAAPQLFVGIVKALVVATIGCAGAVGVVGSDGDAMFAVAAGDELAAQLVVVAAREVQVSQGHAQPQFDR